MDRQEANLFVKMVRDLEDTRETTQGYPYVRTIRNILIANPAAAIAPWFENKPYYGIYEELSLEETESMLEELVAEGKLVSVYTDRLVKYGKRYHTPEYYKEMCDS